MPQKKTLYPPLSPYRSQQLDVGEGHRLHVAEFGAPNGIPALFLHGGPGSGCSPEQARFFDPDRYRVIQIDQRGCGLSQPCGELQGNDLAALINDLKTLRQQLRIQRWLVYGGSWGGTLALEYAKREPERISRLLLRAPFLARGEDLAWFAGPKGAARLHPLAYQRLCNVLGVAQGDDPLLSMHHLLCNDNLSVPAAYTAALAWDSWEAAVMGLPAPANEPNPELQTARVRRKRIYTHYCLNSFFLSDNGVLEDLQRLQQIPLTILQGDEDRVCRPAGAELLKRRLPHARLIKLSGCGHGFEAESMRIALLGLLDSLTP